MLAGCSGSQPPIGAPGVMPQTHAITAHANGGKSRTMLEAKRFETLYTFKGGNDGAGPNGGLIAFNGVFYGTTSFGGDKAAPSVTNAYGERGLRCPTYGCGVVFSMTTSGREEVLHRFGIRKPDGLFPQAGLIALSGLLYGTTQNGGNSEKCFTNCGTVFSITPSGGEKVLYSFKSSDDDGALPAASLIALDDVLYGTTYYWGVHGCGQVLRGCGTVFSVTASGQEKALHKFGAKNDGRLPVASLISVKGVLYGTTSEGGIFECGKVGCGTVFSVTRSGKENILYSFAGGADGATPVSSLISLNGVLYGTTSQGGGSGCNGVGCGVVFSLTRSGQEKVLYTFRGGADGATPVAGLIAANGTLYGTTSRGGGSGCNRVGCGTIFSVTRSGQEKVLYRFTGGADGFDPIGNLTALNDAIYGTTWQGGLRSAGTFFRLAP